MVTVVSHSLLHRSVKPFQVPWPSSRSTTATGNGTFELLEPNGVRFIKGFANKKLSSEMLQLNKFLFRCHRLPEELMRAVPDTVKKFWKEIWTSVWGVPLIHHLESSNRNFWPRISHRQFLDLQIVFLELCPGENPTKIYRISGKREEWVLSKQGWNFLTNREVRRVWSGKNHGAAIIPQSCSSK